MATVSLLVSISLLDWFTECRESLCLSLPVYFQRLIERVQINYQMGQMEKYEEPRALLILQVSTLQKVTCLYLKAPWGLDLLDFCIWGPNHLAFHGSFICGTSRLQQQLSGITSAISPPASAEVGGLWTEIAGPFNPDLVFSVIASILKLLIDCRTPVNLISITHFTSHGYGAFGVYMSGKKRKARERENMYIYTHLNMCIRICSEIYMYICVCAYM